METTTTQQTTTFKRGRGRPRKYTDEQREEVNRIYSHEYYIKHYTPKVGGHVGRPRKYATLEEAAFANKQKSQERYRKQKEEKMKAESK